MRRLPISRLLERLLIEKHLEAGAGLAVLNSPTRIVGVPKKECDLMLASNEVVAGNMTMESATDWMATG